jgi:hypothetical protein
LLPPPSSRRTRKGTQRRTAQLTSQVSFFFDFAKCLSLSPLVPFPRSELYAVNRNTL